MAAPVARERRSAGPPVGLAWNWTDALLGATYALPGAVVALSDPPRGIALAIGVLPAALLGLLPRRRKRVAIVALGVLTGIPVLIGGLLAGAPAVAVIAVGLLGIAAAWLAMRSRAGTIVMYFSLPMVGIGLSYADVGTAAGLAGLIIVGSLWAFAVSMAWPQRAIGPPPEPAPPAERATLGYGLRLGLAGASAAAIGFAFSLDHVGWACAAALLVMRPAAEMQRLRSVGRIVAVAVGALAAIGLLRLDPPDVVLAIAVILAIAGAAGTHPSRWYVTAAFTTFLVFLLLLYGDRADAGSRLSERLLETVLGVGIAYFFGLLLPVARRRS